MALFEIIRGGRGGEFFGDDYDDMLHIEGGEVVFRPNFSGEIRNAYDKGTRKFSFKIDNPDVARDLSNMHVNIKQWVSKSNEDPDAAPLVFTDAIVQYRYANGDPVRPEFYPKVFIVDGQTLTPLTEETIGSLDNQTIESFDAFLKPRHWEYMNKSGSNLQVSQLYLYIRKAPLFDKYANYGIANGNSQPIQTGVPSGTNDIPVEISNPLPFEI